LGLGQEFVPKLEWKISVSGTEAGDEMVLESLDGTLGGIDTVFVWRNELPFYVIGTEEIGDCI
jgi:hypothetical protein